MELDDLDKLFKNYFVTNSIKCMLFLNTFSLHLQFLVHPRPPGYCSPPADISLSKFTQVEPLYNVSSILQ